ncbi:MAG: hypothetical protein OXF98_03355, partial [Rhodospirillaceae bacterium]|nr:hypothetical protein [Rhodospirillaceae bacterium]
MMSFFLSADWSKHPEKRSVYTGDLRARRIRRAEPPGGRWRFDGLVDLATDLSRDGPVLMGVDFVLGVPQRYWQLVL